MTSLARLLVRLDVVDANEVSTLHAESFTDAIAVLAPNGKREPVAMLAGVNKDLNAPADAKGVIIFPRTGAGSWTLVGDPADSGIPLSVTASGLPICPIVLPLNLSTGGAVQLLCGVDSTAELVWF